MKMPEETYRLDFIVPLEYDGAPLKAFLRGYCGMSARLLTALKREEDGILKNGAFVRVIDTVRAGDRIAIHMPRESCFIPPVPLPLHVIYEDAHLLVLDKPAGMPVHPTSCGHTGDTLANAVSFYMAQKGESYAFRPLNRLDKDTTGLVLTAKEPFSACKLTNCVEKAYLAVCEGELSGSGTVNAPIKIKQGHTIEREVSSGGQNAVTHYTALQRFDGHTLLSLRLETGRTHQIRVHMAYLGHPLLGDDMYGGSLKQTGRQALHCAQIRFSHPITGKPVELSAPLPADMVRLLAEKSTK